MNEANSQDVEAVFDDVMDEEENDEVEESVEGLPEAPLSIHIDSYYKGFHVGFTIRKTDNSKLPSGSIKKLVDSLVDKGYEPSWNTETNQQVKQSNGQASSGHKCEQCGADTKYRTGTNEKSGKKWAGYFCTANTDHDPKWVSA